MRFNYCRVILISFFVITKNRSEQTSDENRSWDFFRNGDETVIRRWEEIQSHSAGDTSRIYKGTLATKGKFPYMAYILGPVGTCSASVISVKTVLTASHCLFRKKGSPQPPAERFRVRYDTIDYTKGPIMLVRELVAPLDRTSWGDIGMLITKGEFPDHVATLGIPRLSTIFQKDTEITQIGWGAISPDSPPHNLLRFLVSKLLGNNSCFLQNNHKYLSRICISRENGAACWGDSGGPVVISNKTGFDVIIGVLSYMFESCYENKHGWGSVATRVSYFTDWILEKGEGPFNVIDFD